MSIKEYYIEKYKDYYIYLVEKDRMFISIALDEDGLKSSREKFFKVVNKNEDECLRLLKKVINESESVSS